jgi:SAM-dependent methyltransferase
MPHDPSTGYCCNQDFERLFDEREAASDLEDLLRDGPAPATLSLIDALTAEGVEGASLLDIGAGVGAVHLELLAAGAATAVDVDASHAYLALARAEAERRGVADRVDHRFGDVVELAAELPPADVVTLDRVVCCYPDLPALLGAAMRPPTRLVGLVHPPEAWWMRASMTVFNVGSRLLRRHHSFYVHRHATIDRILGTGGFAPSWRGGGRMWRVSVYRRSA